ncbi:ndufa2, NADH:ubiquinone oxidoreductase 10.5kD subunit [Scheffersomyces spartinae]|uniref:Ndufa2, NADH:ubiquinone oxidoreductase 10.5kD subunit n=1 Tax=Scheffersomyces spartinae TaxID=45513 RepID=A0A9P7V6W0_9ASCO|nr:ndufa2, NADH:ubiquinone oxidoreductase 10.5kD subunit [Scheffersomyces spartinae]KAG7192470.1 ndufa2, NADH:ubiquinone oxidoreductase 10.5kD subunit [Scheffersomyces spartinae]
MSKFAIPTALRELRFHLSQTGEASVPLRNFLSKNYTALKGTSKLPILVRESFGIPPSVTARFVGGVEKKTNLDKLDAQGIESALKDMLKQ